MDYRETSAINGVTYLPWNDSDLTELRRISTLAQDFDDPAGLLRLSDKQKAHFDSWLRPFDISDSPKMIHLISSFSIKQVKFTAGSLKDCSPALLRAQCS